jgi:hypothetical protein
MGREPLHQLGLGHHQFRLVDWYWSRRNAYLGHPFAVPPTLAYRGKPCGGGHDHFCGNLRRSVPDFPHGTRLAGILYHAVPEYPRTDLDQLQLPAFVGRICHLDVFLGIAPLLVHWFGT